MVYVGSSVLKIGGCARLQQHERYSNKDWRDGESCPTHYRSTRRHDVATNFRIAGVWQNPNVIPESKNHNGQDLERWAPVFWEGLLMVYLDLYKQKGPSIGISTFSMFPDSSYRLANSLRDGLSLPSFASASLNLAWPLVQGVSGGMVVATHCANVDCRWPTVRTTEDIQLATDYVMR